MRKDFTNNRPFDKRYFIIDQQLARQFVEYSECLYNHPPPLPFYATPIINPFLTSKISAKYDKGLILILAI